MSNTKMAVGIVEPIGGHGGMDYYDYGLSLGLYSNGVEVFLFTSGETSTRYLDNVHTVKVFNEMWKAIFPIKVAKYIMGHVKSFKMMKKRNISILHLHLFSFRYIDYLVLKIARLHKLKIVVTMHDIQSFDGSDKQIVEKRIIELCDAIIVHNSYSKKVLLEKNSLVSNIAVIPHGNYLPFIEPVKSQIINEEFNFLFFGQIKEVKGLDILLNAASILKNQGYKFKITIAGKPWKISLDSILSMIHALGLTNIVNCDFRYIPDNEVSRYYENASLVVLPYREIYQSGVLLLSMSFGRPVLCSNLPAFLDVIKDGENGIIFESENHDSLADKLKLVLDRQIDLNSITNNAKDTIQNRFDWNHIGKLTKDMYAKLSLN